MKAPPSANSDEEKTVQFVYISVPDTLANITEVPEFKPEMPPQDGLLRDVKDGLVYRSNPFFLKFPDAYTLIFYSDAIEINNPLGAKKGVYKLVNVYWSFAELPKHLRSRTENWFLAISVKEKDLKLNREAVYKPLVDDLLRLEQGIPVRDGKILRAGLLCHLGDNLESHTVGGFSTCFSSRDVCRKCHIQYSDLQDMTGLPKALPWSKEEYDNIVLGNSENQFGLKEACVFNVLESFHAVGQFPMDPLHDFYEKLGVCDAQAVIVTLAETGKISLDRYNDLLSNLKLEDYESSDRPLPVNSKADKLSGKALSVALHIRLMPFLLASLLDEDFESELLDLLLVLSKLNEFILADCFSPVDVLTFQDLVVEYFEKKKICKERYPSWRKNVSRDHFVEHYSQQILDFGPFTCIWTARCESRHRDFVNFSESSKNFINIVKTLSVKNQKKMASRFYSGFFSEPDIQFPVKLFTPAECGSLPAGLFMMKDKVTDKIVIKNTKYRVGQIVVTKVESDAVLEAGKIMKIVVRANEVYLLLTRYECARTNFMYFDAFPLDIVLVKYSSLCDYKPLVCRAGGEGDEYPRFLLHHHLPCRVDEE